MEDAVEHSPINLQTNDSANYKVHLNWSHYNGNKVKAYNIIRNDVILAQNLSSNTNNYLDPTAYCNRDYNYKIESIFDDPTIPNSKSNLGSLEVIGITKNDQITNVTSASVIDDKGVEMKWITPTVGKEIIETYLIYQSTNQGTFEMIDKIDKDLNRYFAKRTDVLNNQYVFKIKTVNSCKLVSNFGQGVSTILLSKKRINNLANLTWTPIIGWETGETLYHIQEIDKTGLWVNHNQKFKNTYESTFEFLKPNTTGFTYRVIGTNDSMISISNTVHLNENYNLYVPNVFTPNGDGLNDQFKAYGTGINNFRMRIVSRTGRIVFETNDIENGWDGKIEGRFPSPGIFHYEIHLNDQKKNNNIVKKGTTFLAR